MLEKKILKILSKFLCNLTCTLDDWQLTTSNADTKSSNTTADFLQESKMMEFSLPCKDKNKVLVESCNA